MKTMLLGALLGFGLATVGCAADTGPTTDATGAEAIQAGADAPGAHRYTGLVLNELGLTCEGVLVRNDLVLMRPECAKFAVAFFTGAGSPTTWTGTSERPPQAPSAGLVRHDFDGSAVVLSGYTQKDVALLRLAAPTTLAPARIGDYADEPTCTMVSHGPYDDKGTISIYVQRAGQVDVASAGTEGLKVDVPSLLESAWRVLSGRLESPGWRSDGHPLVCSDKVVGLFQMKVQEANGGWIYQPIPTAWVQGQVATLARRAPGK